MENDPGNQGAIPLDGWPMEGYLTAFGTLLAVGEKFVKNDPTNVPLRRLVVTAQAGGRMLVIKPCRDTLALFMAAGQALYQHIYDPRYPEAEWRATQGWQPAYAVFCNSQAL